MTSSTSFDVTKWIALADATEKDRVAKMKPQYEELAGMSEEDRLQRLGKMARAEYGDLSDAKLHAFTKSRLGIWLEMDRDQANTILNSYEEVLRTLPATLAMRRVGTVQTIARDLPVDQLDRLYELIPSLLKEMPRRVITSLDTGVEKTERQRGKKRSWWKFW